jgi:hypothetical protein
MSFADKLATLNEWHFFAEFVYSKNVFRADHEREFELADSLLFLGTSLVAFQLKERSEASGATPESESRWFQKKIIGKATKQIRDTIEYLKLHDEIPLQNHRGHVISVKRANVRRLHKLVVYASNGKLPEASSRLRFHQSKTAGVIHLIKADDYEKLVKTLLTPAELTDYLSFREELVQKWRSATHGVPEAALVGQYLAGDINAAPDEHFQDYVARLNHKPDEWDMSGVISKFPARITTGGEPTDYYPIVTALALLKRNELREFKIRLIKAVEKAKANEFALPYRIEAPREGIGFVFVPLQADSAAHASTAVLNFTLAHKYDRRLSRCVGLAVNVLPEGGQREYMITWCYVEGTWERDEEMEKQLRENFPFRPVKEKVLPRYDFRNS